MGILCIASQKGGTGKTTSAINLSAIWAEKKNTLLVDLDPQGNAGSGLRIDNANITITSVLKGDLLVREAIIKTHFNKLSVLPSNVSLSDLDSKELNVNKLKETLRPLQDDYPNIIIDCPPSLGELSLSALIAADSVLIPFKPSLYSLDGLEQLTDTIKAVRRTGFNPNLKIIGIFFNEINTRTRLFKLIKEPIQQAYANLLLKTVIRPTVKLAEAPLVGEPISIYNKKAAKDYINLAKEVMKKWQTS